MATTRGGRKRMNPIEYKRMLRSQGLAKDPSSNNSAERSLACGYRADKGPLDRRPHKGGRVHF